MPNVLRPFAEKGTELLSGPFRRARIWLTLMYVVILAVILFLSSSITYSAFSRQLNHRFARPQDTLPPDFWQISNALNPADVRSDLWDALIIVNGLLLLSAGTLSYWLAGITLAPVQTAYTRQQQFLSDASHELRTPLAILQVDLENELSTKDVNEHVRERAASQLEEVTRMTRLVSDLLALSRAEEGHAAEPMESVVQLNEVIEQVVKQLLPAATNAEVALKITPCFLDSAVFANRDLVVQAITNVINNAILYNSRPGSITVTIHANNRLASVIIEDSGVGIAPEDLPYIFERFYRVDKSRARHTGGSGLGLPIVQTIMDRLHGTISVQSTLGKGTRVALNFPIHSTS